jgi:hypothetical protein
VQAAPCQWKESQPTLEGTKLVFLDETGAGTNMTHARGHAPKGKRCVASVPHGHRQITTLITGLPDAAEPMHEGSDSEQNRAD